MVLDKVAEKAKKGREALKAAVKENAESLRTTVDESSAPKSAADHQWLKGELKDFALEKVVDRVDQFNAALPTFEKVGFKLSRFDVEIGISPSVQAHFEITRMPTEEEKQSALDELIADATLHSLLDKMLKANRLQKVLEIGELELKGLSVKLSAMPTVELVFKE